MTREVDPRRRRGPSPTQGGPHRNLSPGGSGSDAVSFDFPTLVPYLLTLSELVPVLQFKNAWLRNAARAPLERLPALEGKPIIVQRIRDLRDRRGPVHAGSFIRRREIAFDCTRSEFPRIFVHELFHFAWVRAGNKLRLSYENELKDELRRAFPGELGWSAEWRKLALKRNDIRTRNMRWREYSCESFCDTGAWLYSGLSRHAEFTLSPAGRRARRAWFHSQIGGRPLPI